MADQLEPQVYKSLLARAEMCDADPDWNWDREPKNRRHAMNACLDLREARKQIAILTAERDALKKQVARLSAPVSDAAQKAAKEGKL